MKILRSSFSNDRRAKKEAEFSIIVKTAVTTTRAHLKKPALERSDILFCCI